MKKLIYTSVREVVREKEDDENYYRVTYEYPETSLNFPENIIIENGHGDLNIYQIKWFRKRLIAQIRNVKNWRLFDI